MEGAAEHEESLNEIARRVFSGHRSVTKSTDVTRQVFDKAKGKGQTIVLPKD